MEYVDAVVEGLVAGASADPELNRQTLETAYAKANDAGVPLMIPAGTYMIALPDPSRSTVALTLRRPGARTGSGLPSEVRSPIIGAGSGVTRLDFYYAYTPVWTTTGPPNYAVGGSWGWAIFVPADSADSGVASIRMQGLTIAMADKLGYFPTPEVDIYGGADPGNGYGVPAVFGVNVEDSVSVELLDVVTTGWYVALVFGKVYTGGRESFPYTVHLERCYVKSRGGRISCATGALTLIDCWIEQDADGIMALPAADKGSYGWMPAVDLGKAVNLEVIGGGSLGNREYEDSEDNGIYSFHSDSTGMAFEEVPARRLSIRDHYFSATAGEIQFTGSNLSTAVLVDNCVFDRGGVQIGGGVAGCTYHVSNCTFNALTGAVHDAKGGAAGAEVHFENCLFWADNEDDHPLVSKKHGNASEPWYFSNCTFRMTAFRSMIDAVDGVMIFHHCEFYSSHPMALPIVYRHGRLEMYDCTVDASGYCSFENSGDLWEPEPTHDPNFPDDPYKNVPNTHALFIVIERCTFRSAGTAILFQPTAATYFRGRDNEFGDGGRSSGRVRVERAMELVSVPALLESDLQLRRGRGSAELVPADEITDTPAFLRIDLDGDWFEIDVSEAIARIYPWTEGSSIREETGCFPLGATIQLFAVNAFTLTGGGNIALVRRRTFDKGSVATLRFLHRSGERFGEWVVVA